MAHPAIREGEGERVGAREPGDHGAEERIVVRGGDRLQHNGETPAQVQARAELARREPVQQVHAEPGEAVQLAGDRELRRPTREQHRPMRSADRLHHV